MTLYDLLLALIVFAIAIVVAESCGSYYDKKFTQRDPSWICTCEECGETFRGRDHFTVAKRYAQHHYAMHDLEPGGLL